jgi:hypothetical protein
MVGMYEFELYDWKWLGLFAFWVIIVNFGARSVVEHWINDSADTLIWYPILQVTAYAFGAFPFAASLLRLNSDPRWWKPLPQKYLGLLKIRLKELLFFIGIMTGCASPVQLTHSSSCRLLPHSLDQFPSPTLPHTLPGILFIVYSSIDSNLIVKKLPPTERTILRPILGYVVMRVCGALNLFALRFTTSPNAKIYGPVAVYANLGMVPAQLAAQASTWGELFSLFVFEAATFVTRLLIFRLAISVNTQKDRETADGKAPAGRFLQKQASTHGQFLASNASHGKCVSWFLYYMCVDNFPHPRYLARCDYRAMDVCMRNIGVTTILIAYIFAFGWIHLLGLEDSPPARVFFPKGTLSFQFTLAALVAEALQDIVCHCYTESVSKSQRANGYEDAIMFTSRLYRDAVVTPKHMWRHILSVLCAAWVPMYLMQISWMFAEHPWFVSATTTNSTS